MSILLMANVMELDIQSGAKFILLVMANFASDEGENVYPSHETIARLTSMSRRTVVSTVKQLVDDGYVVLDGKKGNRQNIYSLNVDKIMGGGSQVRKIFTPDEVSCEAVAQNPLSIKRLKDLEDAAMSFDGVEKVYAVSAGREVRVFVKPEKVDDYSTALLAKEIARKIELEQNYPGVVKVIVIRETRVSETAK